MAPTSTLRLASSGCWSGNSGGLSKNGWRDQYRPCAAASLRSAPKCCKPGAPSNCYCNGITKYGQWGCGFGYEKAGNFALWDLATSRQAGISCSPQPIYRQIACWRLRSYIEASPWSQSIGLGNDTFVYGKGKRRQQEERYHNGRDYFNISFHVGTILSFLSGNWTFCLLFKIEDIFSCRFQRVGNEVILFFFGNSTGQFHLFHEWNAKGFVKLSYTLLIF